MIDFHTHIFPEHLAERAISTLSESSGNMLAYSTAVKDDLIRAMDESGVDAAVVLNIATNGKQMQKVNDFSISVNGYKDRLISFGSIYPDSNGSPASVTEELHRLRENGIKGIKLHPEYQDFYADDDKLAPIYETVSKLNMITVFHAGMDNGFDDLGRASPARMARVLDVLKSPVVAAHMGGYIDWLAVEEHLVGKDVYFDTSFCFSRIPLPIMKRMVNNHGCEKILFGSDLPWSTPLLELRLINAVGVSEVERELILRGNAVRLLGLGG